MDVLYFSTRCVTWENRTRIPVFQQRIDKLVCWSCMNWTWWALILDVTESLIHCEALCPHLAPTPPLPHPPTPLKTPQILVICGLAFILIAESNHSFTIFLSRGWMIFGRFVHLLLFFVSLFWWSAWSMTHCLRFIRNKICMVRRFDIQREITSLCLMQL